MIIDLTYACKMGCSHCISDCKPEGENMSLQQLSFSYKNVSLLKYPLLTRSKHRRVLLGNQPSQRYRLGIKTKKGRCGGQKMLKKKKKEKHYTYPVRDVSHYIIVYSNKKDYGVSNLKLQKLLYFVQAFFLINDCPPCFDEKIEAWDFGPVVPEIYREYKRYGGMDIPTIDYYVKFDKKNIWNTERIYYEDIISDDDKEMIRAVVDKFAHCSATFLVNLTHNQDPWINAYVNGQRNEITKEDIKRYFDD